MLKVKPHWNTRIGRDVILVAAIQLAEQPGGWVRLTRAAIAKRAHCSPGLVSAHLGSMESLKGKLVKVAIKQENFDILIQALMAQDREACKMRPLLKQKALSHIPSGV